MGQMKQTSDPDRTEMDLSAGHTAGAASSRDAHGARGIVIAAAALMRHGGAGAVTTRAVAQAAGVQAPTIYRLFGDKDGLLDAVAEHVMAQWVADKARAADANVAADADPLADLVAGWHSHIGFGLANPDLYALLNTPGRAGRSPAAAAGAAVLRARVHRLAAAGLLAVDEQRAVGLVHAAGVGIVITLLTSPPGQADEGLSEAVLDTVLDAMLVPGARSAHRVDHEDDHDRDTTDRLTPLTAAVALLAHLPDLPALTVAEQALMAEQLTRAIVASRAS